MARKAFNPDLIQVPPEETTRPAPAGARLTVSQVTSLVKQAIETVLPPTLNVVGEISNFKRHTSGHLYLTLKDAYSELSCVMWRSTAAGLKFDPADGMEVVATGSVEVFERAGRYQLYIRKLEPLGIGALELAFRQLCEKLSREGLFDEKKKKPLPAYPQCIAIVTSPTGAAIADVLRTLERRYPCVRALVYPVRVQGPDAAEEIAAAIRQLNANSEALGVDLLIVGRGGGSLEDLWAFNEEIVARAIFASRLPIISAVGHEVDVTIADLVADVRAATPTGAAELAVPVLDDVRADIDAHGMRVRRVVQGLWDVSEARFSGALQRSALREPLAFVHRREQVIDELGGRLHRRTVERVHLVRRVIDRLEPIIQRIAPHALLMRRSAVLSSTEQRLRWAMSGRVVAGERRVSGQTGKLDRTSPVHLVRRKKEQLARAVEVLVSGLRHGLEMHAAQVRRQESRLSAMSYKSVLGRGFSITRTKKGRKVVRSLRGLGDGQRIVTEVADGEFESQVINLNQLELFD